MANKAEQQEQDKDHTTGRFITIRVDDDEVEALQEYLKSMRVAKRADK